MNRIENIIRKMIFDKKKQDVLLENIIKKTLFNEQKTAMAKIARITKKEYEEARAAGAEHAFAVVTRGYSIKKLPEIIARLAERTEETPASGDEYDPNAEYKFVPDESNTDSDAVDAAAGKNKPSSNEKRVSIGPNSKFASSEITVSQNPAYPDDSLTIDSAYRYLIGNIKQRGNKIRCIVWIMPMADNFKFLTYAIKNKDVFIAGGNFGAQIGAASVQLMRDFLAFSENRKNRDDLWREWYLNQKTSELELPPESWYKFAGREPKAAISIGKFTGKTETPDGGTQPENPKPELNNNESDTEQVKNIELGGYKFTGTVKGGAIISGTKEWPVTTEKNRIILQQGEWELSADGNKNKFKTGRVIHNGPVYKDGNRDMYDQTEYYVVDFKIDETAIAELKNLDASTNELLGTYKGTFNQSLNQITGEVKYTSKLQSDPASKKQFYVKSTYYYSNGAVDQTKQSELVRYDASTNKPYAIYKGTVDGYVNPKTGAAYEVINGDLQNLKPAGKFTNGKFS